MTTGEYRVGITFNPSNSGEVAALKTKAAEFIDIIDSIDVRCAEQGRLKALAMTAIEDGAMWAVKASTKRSRETDA